MGHRSPAHELQLEARTDADQKVGILPENSGRGRGGTACVVLRNDATAAAKRRDRGAQHFRKLPDLLAGVLRTAAAHDHDLLRPGNEPGSFLHGIGIDCRFFDRGIPRRNVHIVTCRHGIPAHRQRCRARPPAEHLPECLIDLRGRVFRVGPGGG